MRLSTIASSFIVVGLVFTANAFAQEPEVRAAIPAPHELQIAAKKYEFNPSVITVKKDEHVRLIITASDHDHGFKLDAFKMNQRLKKGEPATVDFIADKAGEFPFQCSVVCGLGHHKMKGKVVVE